MAGYAILPASQWRGYRLPPEPPAPEPGTLGDHPALPDAVTAASGFFSANGASPSRSNMATAIPTMQPQSTCPQRLTSDLQGTLAGNEGANNNPPLTTVPKAPKRANANPWQTTSFVCDGSGRFTVTFQSENPVISLKFADQDKPIRLKDKSSGTGVEYGNRQYVFTQLAGKISLTDLRKKQTDTCKPYR